MEAIPFDFYITIIAASLSLCGIAGIISLFKQGKEFDEGEKHIFRSLLKVGFSVAIGAFFPMILAEALGDIGFIWGFSSYVYAVLAAYYTVTEQIAIEKGTLQIRHEDLARILKWGGYASACLAYINIWPFARSSVFVMYALLWGLAVVSARLYFFFKAITDDQTSTAESRETKEVRMAMQPKHFLARARDQLVKAALIIPLIPSSIFAIIVVGYSGWLFVSDIFENLTNYLP